jgi:hypothetical protein
MRPYSGTWGFLLALTKIQISLIFLPRIIPRRKKTMKFAVFSEDAIVYLGQDPTEAAEAFRSKNGVKLEYAKTIEELQDRFATHVNQCKAQSFEDVEDCLSDALETLLERLDDMGINPQNAELYADKLANASQKVVKIARYLGHTMMKTVGENFIWLGDLLKEEAELAEKTKV